MWKAQGQKPLLDELGALRQHCMRNRHATMINTATWTQEELGKPQLPTTWTNLPASLLVKTLKILSWDFCLLNKQQVQTEPITDLSYCSEVFLLSTPCIIPKKQYVNTELLEANVFLTVS